jgi:hypothetical protein
VANATARYQNQVEVLATMYAEMGAWDVVTEQFPSSGNNGISTGQGGQIYNSPATPINTPVYSPIGGGDAGSPSFGSGGGGGGGSLPVIDPPLPVQISEKVGLAQPGVINPIASPDVVDPRQVANR